MQDPFITALEYRLLGEIYGGNLIAPSTVGAIASATGVQLGMGKEAIHQLYPDEIEYFAIALELIDSNGDTENFFSFPVLTGNISISDNPNLSIQKTLGGVVVNNNPTFTPFDVNISGHFGRRFRNLAPGAQISNVNNAPDDGGDVVIIPANLVFSSDYKTGYGCTRILKSIIEKSRTLDTFQRPYRLVLYNLTFNQTHLVEVQTAQFFVNKDLNGIWQYSLPMRAIAPAVAIFTQQRLNTSIKNLLAFNKKTTEFNQQANAAQRLFDKTMSGDTPVRRVLNKTLGNSSQIAQSISSPTSGFTEIQSLLSNPLSADNFITNQGMSILNDIG